MNTTDELLERLIVNMEAMIRAQDDMHEENKYSNYRERERIKNDRYQPARNELKETFIELVKTIKNTA